MVSPIFLRHLRLQAHERDAAVHLRSYGGLPGGELTGPRSLQRSALEALLPGAGEPDQSGGRGPDGGRSEAPVKTPVPLESGRERTGGTTMDLCQPLIFFHPNGCVFGGDTISVAKYYCLGESPQLTNQGLLIRG